MWQNQKILFPCKYIKIWSQLQFTCNPSVQILLGFMGDSSTHTVSEVLIRWRCHYRWHQACVTWRLAGATPACHWAEMDFIPHLRADRSWAVVLLLSLWNSLCDSTAVLQLSHRDHIGTENRRSSLWPTVELQETLTLATGALALHLSKFHWLLYTSLWFAEHGALESTVDSDCQVVLKDHAIISPSNCMNSTLLPQISQSKSELFKLIVS